MTHTRLSLAADLRRLGLAPGGIVMVHASVRAVGPVFGGPDQIHLAVCDALGPGGTMTMLLGCPDGYDDIGRAKTTPQDAAALRGGLPVFDSLTTRANRDNGTLAEFFRSWPGTMVSPCVSARMGARGGRADWLTAAHSLLYPFGRGTPFEKLVQAGGQVLLLGSDHDQVTLMHHAESIADFEDKIVVRYEVPLSIDGQRVWVPCEEFDSSDPGCHANWPPRFFALIVDDFIARHAGTPACRTGTVGHADAVLLDAAALVAHAVPAMERVARDGWSPG